MKTTFLPTLTLAIISTLFLGCESTSPKYSTQHPLHRIIEENVLFEDPTGQLYSEIHRNLSPVLKKGPIEIYTEIKPIENLYSYEVLGILVKNMKIETFQSSSSIVPKVSYAFESIEESSREIFKNLKNAQEQN